MNRSQVEYIIQLEKHKNFGRAAEASFITQSTLSAMVAKFEEQIGIEIFNRKTRPISITPQGEKIIKRLKSIHREYQLLDESIDNIKGHEISQLTIACIPTVAPYLYPLFLNKISRSYPKVNFIITEDTTERILDQILSGDIDIGIVSIPLDHPEINQHHLYNEDFLVYDCGLSKKKKKYKVSDIDLNRLWLMEEGHCMRNQVSEICELKKQKKINGNLTYNCGSVLTLIHMVSLYKGITLLPRSVVENDSVIEKGNIHSLSGTIPARSIGFITHKNFTKKKILLALTSEIKSATSILEPPQKKSQKIVSPF